jgi:hypothetical protein
MPPSCRTGCVCNTPHQEQVDERERIPFQRRSQTPRVRGVRSPQLSVRQPHRSDKQVQRLPRRVSCLAALLPNWEVSMTTPLDLYALGYTPNHTRCRGYEVWSKPGQPGRRQFCSYDRRNGRVIEVWTESARG